VVLFSSQLPACCGVMVHVLLVLRVCALCAVLLMARQGTHLYVLNRDPGGRRHLCADAHCMCVAGCSACSSILVCAWVVLVPCCSAWYMQAVWSSQACACVQWGAFLRVAAVLACLCGLCAALLMAL
jgi:hypothetical protein